MEQVTENVRTWSEDKPLDKREFEAVTDIGRRLFSGGVLPCTACCYCVERCPQGLDIPRLIALYNEHIFSGGGFIAPSAVSALPAGKRPDACVACHSCEAVCPQQLKIPDTLAKFAELLKG